MKLLGLLSSVAVASAQWPLVAHPNGAVVPADEPAVVAARADHLRAHHFGGRPLVAHPNGAVTPADEPAVVAARADHLRAKDIAFHAAVASGPGLVGPAFNAAPIAAPVAPVIAQAGPVFAPVAPIIAGPRQYIGPLAGVPHLVAHPNGAVTPADTPSVVAARADHLAAKGAAFHAAVASGPGFAGPVAGPAFAPAVHAIGPIAPAGPAFAPALPYVGPLAGVPHLVAHPNGAVTPADEPAVVAARADHFRAKGLF